MRLHNSTDYRNVFDTGKKYHSKSFVFFLSKKQFGPTRLGITVSRKVGGAIKRNRIKRVLREIFRLNYFQLSPNTDIVIIVKKTAVNHNYDQLKQEFMNICSWT